VYVGDPVNENDYSGNCAFLCLAAVLNPITLVVVTTIVLITVVVTNPAFQQAVNNVASQIKTGINNLVKSIVQTKADTNKRKTCTNCGVYKFVDTGATNPVNKGKTYIGKTADFDRRKAQHGPRIAPGSFQIVARMDGSTSAQIRVREQDEINEHLRLFGIPPFGVSSGVLANRINSIAEKNYTDLVIEAGEFSTF